MYHRARVGGNAGPYTQGHDYLEEQVRPKFYWHIHRRFTVFIDIKNVILQSQQM
jgi:hypothetical protein